MNDLVNSKIASLLNTMQPCIVDIDARGGVDEYLLGIARACSVYRFELEPEEAEWLEELADRRWKRVKILPYAVGSFSGKSTLYLPESEQGASLLTHNLDMIERFGY